MKPINTLFIGICSVFVACASSINPLNADAKSVRIVTNEPTSGCVYLGEVYGYQRNSGGLNAAELDMGAINDTKNKAKELGGNTIFLLNNQNNIVYNNNSNFIVNDRVQISRSVNITALVYQCE